MHTRSVTSAASTLIFFFSTSFFAPASFSALPSTIRGNWQGRYSHTRSHGRLSGKETRFCEVGRYQSRSFRQSIWRQLPRHFSTFVFHGLQSATSYWYSRSQRRRDLLSRSFGLRAWQRHMDRRPWCSWIDRKPAVHDFWEADRLQTQSTSARHSRYRSWQLGRIYWQSWWDNDYASKRELAC